MCSDNRWTWALSGWYRDGSQVYNSLSVYRDAPSIYLFYWEVDYRDLDYLFQNVNNHFCLWELQRIRIVPFWFIWIYKIFPNFAILFWFGFLWRGILGFIQISPFFFVFFSVLLFDELLCLTILLNDREYWDLFNSHFSHV